MVRIPKLISLVLSLFFLFLTRSMAKESSWSVVSPNGKCEISVSLDSGQLTYQTTFDGKVVIQKSPLGLKRDDQDFESGLVFENIGEVKVRSRDACQ